MLSTREAITGHLSRWDPFRELEQIQARLNRVFGGIAGTRGTISGLWCGRLCYTKESDASTRPRPIFRSEEGRCEVEFEDGVLTVQGETQAREGKRKGRGSTRSSGEYGKFARLLCAADARGAEFKEGRPERPPAEVTATASQPIAVKVT